MVVNLWYKQRHLLKIEDKIPEFVTELLKGKHIEIHLAKDNDVKVFSVDKKIVK